MLAKTFLFFLDHFYIFIHTNVYDMIVVLVMNWLVNVRNFSRYLFDVSTYFSFGKSDGILLSNLFIE